MSTDPSPSRPARFGLALGGGSVFGYAHVGVLEALDAHGLRPDALAGTSAGAIAATLVAFGVPTATVRDRFATMTWRQITEFAPGRLGMFTNAPLGELMDDLVGHARIEDARIPLAIVASDIETGEQVVLRDGPAAEAVRASACLPGLYAPVEIGGRQLVDGGVLENVPVGPLRDDGAEVVVAVNLMADVPYSRVRTLSQVLINASSFSLRASTRLDLDARADIVVQPDLTGRASWDARDLPGLLAEGRRATEAKVPDIRRALDRAARRARTPASAFARTLADGLRQPGGDLPPLRVGPVQCDAGAFCTFTVATAAPVHVVYLLSLWPEGDHVLVRVESGTMEERVRVPLHGGAEAERDEAQQAIRDAIAVDLGRITFTDS